MPDSHDLRFSHALIRETLYDEMLALRRSRLHLRIGELLEQRHGSDDASVWSQLAYHFSEAGAGSAATKALDYAQRAGEHAARLLAFEESTRLYGVALQLLQRHFPGDLAQRCAVLLALGEAQKWFGVGRVGQRLVRPGGRRGARMRTDGPRSHVLRSAFRTAAPRPAIQAKPAVALLLEAIAMHPGDDAVRVELLARLCVAYVYCDRADEAMDAHRSAVALARDIGDPRSLYVALASIVHRHLLARACCRSGWTPAARPGRSPSSWTCASASSSCCPSTCTT